jgi:hypothetical protein
MDVILRTKTFALHCKYIIVFLFSLFVFLQKNNPDVLNTCECLKCLKAFLTSVHHTTQIMMVLLRHNSLSKDCFCLHTQKNSACHLVIWLYFPMVHNQLWVILMYLLNRNLDFYTVIIGESTKKVIIVESTRTDINWTNI